MFTTGSLGDYLGIPTRKAYYSSSTYVTGSIASCSSTKKISLIPKEYSWPIIVSRLGFNKDISTIPGVSCASSYDKTSTILLKTSIPLKVQRYRNANIEFYLLNNVKRDYISHGLLVGINPGNTITRSWEFNIPVNKKEPIS